MTTTELHPILVLEALTFCFSHFQVWKVYSVEQSRWHQQSWRSGICLHCNISSVHTSWEYTWVPLLSVCEATMFARPQLSKLHFTSQISERSFTDIPAVLMGLYCLGYKGFCSHLQDGLVVGGHTWNQISQQHTGLFLHKRNARDMVTYRGFKVQD